MANLPSRNVFPTRIFQLPSRSGMGQALWVILCGFILASALMIHRAWPVPPAIQCAMFGLSVAAILFVRFHLRHTTLKGVEVLTSERIVWVGALAAVLGVQAVNLSLGPRELLGAGFLMTVPLLAQAMLVSALLGPSLSLVALTVTCMLVGVGGAANIEALAAGWLGGAIAAHAVNPIKRRSDLLRAVSVVSVAQAAIALCATAMMSSEVRPVLESAAWAAVAAVIATSIFWLGSAIVERGFGLVSDWSLLELCSPEHPVLHQLTLRAPGTYAHSVMVGNLAEHAARDVGANPLLCRAMAYFHDIGKLERPNYFVENQHGQNRHDKLNPRLSARIVMAHVADGIALARQHHLPQAIVDGIEQHHGTGLVAYFYHRACKSEGSGQVLEEEFRYNGPKPQTVEAGILLLADGVEAISRTITPGGTEDLEIAIRRLIEERRADGQLDECPLTLRDLRTIERSFLRTLSAVRHERIPYPDDLAEHARSKPSHLDLEQLRASYPDEFPPYGA